MNIKELINYLQIAQEKLSGETEVFITNSYDEEEHEVEDIVMKAERSLMDTNSFDIEDSKLLIYF